MNERSFIYPPSQNTTSMPVDAREALTKSARADDRYATARCRPKNKADNHVVAAGEDGYFKWDQGFTRGAPWVL
ncbi:hypothetical protein ACFL7E_07270 [Thermodesulfobacteriota bacterium]